MRGAVDRYGRLDIVVNDAADVPLPRGRRDAPRTSGTVSSTRTSRASTSSATTAIPHLRAAGGGSIVNVSSVHAYATMERVAAYAASKGAIVALSPQMALDYTRDRIRVNALMVGGVDTAMAASTWRPSARPSTKPASRTTIGSWGGSGSRRRSRPGSLFLVSPEASFVTGSPFYIDGACSPEL